MILQALTGYYEDLRDRGEIEPPGWAPVKVSCGLRIDGEGKLLQAIDLRVPQSRGKKTVMAPQLLCLPAPVKRSSGISPNFLWDNSAYLLGADGKNDPRRARECFEACAEYHRRLLTGVDSPAAKALLAFFESWDPAKARQHPALEPVWQELEAGANLVFRLEEGDFLQQDPALQEAWERAWSGQGEEQGPEGVCLVTGQRGPVQSVHPAVKNVAGAQSSGAALVSFNAPAFCSYGKEQNMNAPTGKYAAFAYTSALNHLLADREHLAHLGDATVVCWARGGQSGYASLFGGLLYGTETPYTEPELRGMALALCRGEKVEYQEDLLDPHTDFYLLGLSPNSARLSVRFFLHNTFGHFLQNLRAHQERLEIARPSWDKRETLSVWAILNETVNQNSKDKTPSPGLAGETLRAILENTPYPATLLNGVVLRIRAERQITRGRAAILKAYYTKLTEQRGQELPDIPKEVLTVSLNPQAKHIPYTLGRLFSVLEAIQSAANPGINTTIRDRYFSAACATPSRVFPNLIKLAQKHMKKLDGGLQVYFERQLTELLALLGQEFPNQLSLPQQGSFQLGYYQQNLVRYQKKEEKDHA